MSRSTKVLYIVGPTASGKTALALQIAQEQDGEIICADSRTIYKGLDIATAKPTAQEQALVPHWGLDLVAPSERFSAAQFKHYAQQKITEIQARGKLPIVVGGTGLYIDGLLFDFSFGPPANLQLRTELEPLNIEELQERIRTLGIAMPTNPQNKRYLVRAIEQGGVQNDNPRTSHPGALCIGINPGIEILEQRIRARAQVMVSAGALQEAEWLYKTYGVQAPAAAAPFYKAFRPYFEDAAPLATCLERYILNDRQLAKRQITWFKRNPNVQWYASAQDAAQNLHL